MMELTINGQVYQFNFGMGEKQTRLSRKRSTMQLIRRKMLVRHT